jgi:hypothetical protein
VKFELFAGGMGASRNASDVCKGIDIIPNIKANIPTSTAVMHSSIDVTVSFINVTINIPSD